MGPGSLSPVSVTRGLGTSLGRFVPPPGTQFPFSDATEPRLSILVPVDAEERGQPPASFPLLCHLHDIPAGWDTVRWQPGGDVTPLMAAAVDEHGVLGAWSIAWVPAERWDGAATCTALKGSTSSTVSVTIGKAPGEGN